jgi:hypothetical protein
MVHVDVAKIQLSTIATKNELKLLSYAITMMKLNKKWLGNFAPDQNQVRNNENLHILLWLIKDTSWILGYKTLGTMMIVPTILMALYITYSTRKQWSLFVPNCAVISWIAANGTWMLGEFYALDFLPFALICFGVGILIMIYYLIVKIIHTSRIDNTTD